MIQFIIPIILYILVAVAAFIAGVKRGHRIAKEIFDAANEDIKKIYWQDKAKLVSDYNQLLETLKMTIKTKNNILTLRENDILRQDEIIQGLKADIEKMQSLDFGNKPPDLRTRLDITERKEIIELIQQPKVNEVSGD